MENSGLIGVHSQGARGSSEGAVRVIIRNVHLLNNYLIPFFNTMSFISKKALDFSDFKLICHIIYIGAHKNKDIGPLLLKLLNTMNNNRLSNSKKSKSIMTADEMALLNNVSPVYEFFSDGSIIDIKTQQKVSQNSIYILTFSESGEVKRVASRGDIASNLGISLTTLSKYLKLQPEGVTIKGCYLRQVGVFGGV